MFYGGEVCGGMVCSQAALVIAEDHVEHPVEAVFDGPMVADERANQIGDENQRGNVETRLAFDLAAGLTGALDHDDTLEARPLMAFLKPVDIVDNRDVSGLDATVVAIDRAGTDREHRLWVVQKGPRVLVQRPLISLQRHDVVAALSNNLSRDLALTVERIDGHDGAFEA